MADISSKTPAVPPFTCSHINSGTPIIRGYRAVCPLCGSFWDLEALRGQYTYSEDYPVDRGHYEPLVADLKAKSLSRWLKLTGINIEGLTVCETGFGGGGALKELRKGASRLYGVEAIEENIEHADPIGADALYLYDERPESLPRAVDFWLFLDSFEHLDEPAKYLRWLRDNSTPSARIMIVAPEAGSLSERFMGRLWPHKLPDHGFHWSKEGLMGFFSEYGFRAERFFSPVKFVSLKMALRHAAKKALPAAKPPALLESSSSAGPVLSFNIGQMGIVFQRASGLNSQEKNT